MDFVYRKNLKIDVYIPDTIGFKTIVYFHGGGLVEGSRSCDNLIEMFDYLKKEGICVFNCDYSLYPNAKFPEYIEDAAYAIKKAFDMNKELGGNGDIYVAGSSAGAYLTLMLCCNKEYLNKVGVGTNKIKAWISESAQPTDHFNILKFEYNKDPNTLQISAISPMFYVRKGFSSNPIFLIAYDEDVPNRYDQNRMFLDRINDISPTTKITLEKWKGTHCLGSSKKDTDGLYPFAKYLNKITRDY